MCATSAQRDHMILSKPKVVTIAVGTTIIKHFECFQPL